MTNFFFLCFFPLTACVALATVGTSCAKMTRRSVAAKSLTTAVQRFISKDA